MLILRHEEVSQPCLWFLAALVSVHLTLSHKNHVGGVQQWCNYSDFLKPVLWILTSFLIHFSRQARSQARSPGLWKTSQRKGENIVALLKEPIPFLSKKKHGGDPENEPQGAVGHLYRAFEVSFLSSGTPGHLVCLPKPTAFDKQLGVL